MPVLKAGMPPGRGYRLFEAATVTSLGKASETKMANVRDGYLSLDDRSLIKQCQVDTYRASGPGGQKRNKTDSAVRLRHGATKLIVVAVESRSQHENRARALKRLRKAIALRIRVPIDPVRYQPGLIVLQCLSKASKLRIGRRDHRYPHVAAEVLDLLDACGCRVASAAEKLGISTANLVAFLQNDVKLWARVNEMRTSAGITPLRWNKK